MLTRSLLASERVALPAPCPLYYQKASLPGIYRLHIRILLTAYASYKCVVCT